MGEIKYPTELEKIIDLLRKKGVKSLKIEGLELELREEAPPSNYKRKKLESVPDKPELALTDEDYLLWSTNASEEAAHA